jgi:phage protein D/phage baseplate assembly protein gpV
MFDLSPSQLAIPGTESADLVTTKIKINGSPVPDTVLPYSISVSRTANRIPFAIITFLDGDVARQEFPTSDLDLLSPGNPIEIHAGYHGNDKLIFKGIIVRHSVRVLQNETPFIEIECKDEAVKMTVGRKNKYYFNQKDSEIIEEILRNHGRQIDVQSTSGKHAEMVQYYATDWDFLNTRAEANGMLVMSKDGKVKVAKPDFGQSPKFPLNYGVNIFEFEAEMDARDQYPTAKATAWDADNQEVQSSEPSGGGGLGGFSAPKVPSALSQAASTVGSAVGVRISGIAPNTDYSKVMGLEHLALQHTGALNQEEAQNWAAAQMTKSQLAKNRGRVKFQGAADIYPGDMLKLEGVGLRHSGKVYITAISHEIEAGMWYTHAQFGLSQRWFAAEFDDVTDQPASALLPAIHGLQIGVVTALKGDPDNAHRVQVRLPLIDGRGDGIWMRVSCQDAGNKFGAFWRPEIGQEVVVGFLNDDPRDAIVVGMLNSTAKPAALQDKDENHQKGWITRGDMRMIFDDEKKSLSITTPGGKKLIIDEDQDKIHLEDQHGNKITMDKDGITLDSYKNMTLKAKQDIKIEAMNITQKAQFAFKAEGTQSQLTASGDVTVKGAIVKIN